MEKKRLKLSISGSSKKTLSSIEQAKTQSKNAVLIEKKTGKYSGRPVYSKPYKQNDKNKQSFLPKKNVFSKPQSTPSDFERRKLAEQRATRRLKGEEFQKDTKGKSGFRKRELVVTTQEQYPQNILVEFVQDRCEILDSFQVGELVKIDINIRGREWTNKDNEVKYFNSIQGWRIEKIEENYDSQLPPIPTKEDLGTSQETNKEPDDLPF